MAALQEADQFIQSSTATFDPSLGKFPMRERSGKAIRALQDQMEFGTSDFLTSLARVSIQHEARIVQDLMPVVYDRPGRVLQILGEEEDERPVMIGRPFVQDGGRAVPADPNDPKAKTYDLSSGAYSITVDVGKSYQTRVHEGRQEMSALIEAQPELFPILGPLMLKYHDAPWSRESAELLKRYRDQTYPGLADKGDDEELTPEETRAKLDAAEQFIQRQTEEMQSLKYRIDTSQPKLESDQQIAQIRAMVDLKVSEMASQTKLKQSQLENQVRVLLEELRQKFDAFERRQDRVQEVAIQASGQKHDASVKAAAIKFGEPRGPLAPDDSIR
jgi:hypothetical protein